MKILNIIVFVFIISLRFSAYSINIDSLRQVAQSAENKDTVRVLAYIELCNHYLIEDLPECYVCVHNAIELSKKNKYDNGLALAYNQLGRYYLEISNYEKALDEFKKNLHIRQKQNNELEMGRACNNIGLAYMNMGVYDSSLNYYFQSLKVVEKLQFDKGIAMTYNNIGILFDEQKDYVKAIEYYIKALEIFKKIKFEYGIAYINNNIGVIYTKQTKFEQAIQSYKEALTYFEKINYLSGVSNSYNNIGIIYEKQKKYEEALTYFQKSLEIEQKRNDSTSMAIAYINMSSIYEKLKDYKKAQEYVIIADTIMQANSNIESLKKLYLRYADLYQTMELFEQSCVYKDKYIVIKDSLYSNQLAERIAEMRTKYETDKKEKQLKIQEQQILLNQSRNKILYGGVIFALIFLILFIMLYLIKRNANKNLAYRNQVILQQKEEIQVQAEHLEEVNRELEKLSIVASETDNAVIIADGTGYIEWVNEAFKNIYGYSLNEFKEVVGDNMFNTSTISDFDKKINNAVQNKNSVIYISKNTSKNGKQIWTQTALKPITYNGKIHKMIAIESDITALKLAEQEILMRNDEIMQQKEEIWAQAERLEQVNTELLKTNKQLTDSIAYAQRIQNAILPARKKISETYQEAFVLYKPKDIVSGDFYWFKKINAHQSLIAAIDCTGHGVPGAFMSLIGYSLLEEITGKNINLQPGEILNQLKAQVIQRLTMQKDADISDGMDMALLKIDTQNKIIQYAGANNPLYCICDNELIEYKANKFPIGRYFKEINKPFVTTSFDYKKNTVLYIFSDGFADQFGGNKTNIEKYTTHKLKKKLLDVHKYDTRKQYNELNNEIDLWMENYKQIDDILLIGIKL